MLFSAILELLQVAASLFLTFMLAMLQSQVQHLFATVIGII
jgi:hypothetical protein